jgi:integrase
MGISPNLGVRVTRRKVNGPTSNFNLNLAHVLAPSSFLARHYPTASDTLRQGFAFKRFQIAFKFPYVSATLSPWSVIGMIGKITKTAVDRMGPWSVLWDTEVNGFGVRRHGTQAKHYLLRFRFQGRQTFRKIGRHGSPFTPDSARAEALRLLGLIVSGTNPAQRQPKAESFGGEVERYLLHKQAARTFTHIERHLRKHAKPLHPLSLAEIDRRRVAQLLAKIEVASGPVARNRVRSSLSAFFTWLVREGLLDANPVTGTGKANESPSRDRVLSQSELAEVWRAASGRFGDVVRLLVFTAQRRSEIGQLRWSEIDWERRMIALPPERTKNKVRHELPLAPAVLEILQRRYKQSAGAGAGPDPNDARVFRGIDWAKDKAQLDWAVKGVKPWRIHDLRRTAATMMAELGVLPHIIEAILNHVSGHKGGVAGIYNRARYEGEMRGALAKWADHIDQITQT